MCRRTVRVAAPARAPTPDADMSNPYASGPPPRMRSAKIGMSTLYGIPIRLTRPSSSSNARTGAVCHENTNPSTMLAQADTWDAARGRRGRRISSNAPMTAV